MFRFRKSFEYKYEYIWFWKIMRIRIRIVFGLKIPAEYKYFYSVSNFENYLNTELFAHLCPTSGVLAGAFKGDQKPHSDTISLLDFFLFFLCVAACQYNHWKPLLLSHQCGLSLTGIQIPPSLFCVFWSGCCTFWGPEMDCGTFFWRFCLEMTMADFLSLNISVWTVFACVYLSCCICLAVFCVYCPAVFALK